MSRETPDEILQDPRARRGRRARCRYVNAQAPEKKDVKLGVGGGAALDYFRWR